MAENNMFYYQLVKHFFGIDWGQRKNYLVLALGTEG